MRCEDGMIPWWLQIACSLCRHNRETSSAVGMTLRAWSPFRKLEGSRWENAHLVEEIHEPIQIRSLEIGQIVIFSIALDQVGEIAGKIRRRSIERVEMP